MIKKYTIVYLLINIIATAQTDTTFISLKGFEDSLGNTHLYYSTKYSSISDEVDSTLYFYNIFDVTNNQNNLFEKGFSLKYFPELFYQESKIKDIEFFNNDPNRYIFIRNYVGIDLDGRISRHDKKDVLVILGNFEDLYITPNNSNHIYAVAGNWIMQSFDEGISWPGDSSFYIKENEIEYLTFSPFEESAIFGVNASNQLVKSIDTGKTFTQVTTLPDLQGNIKLFFDCDNEHIYAVINTYEFNNYYSTIYGFLYRSNNKGNANSWELLNIKYNKMDLCIDDSIPGNLYMSVGNDIYESKDFGGSFKKFAELDHHANGLYKKPNNELFAATANQLIKITKDSTIIILSKSIINSLYFYPLAVGNKWFYNNSGVSYDTEPHPFNENYFEEIIKDTIDQRGIHYFYLRTKPFGEKYWLRIDSLTGKVFKRYSFEFEDEYLLFDLSAYAGDEFLTQEGIVYNIVESDTVVWEKKRYSKIYQLESLGSYQITFVEGIGIVKRLNEFDFGYSTTKLLGCVLSGKVYGDTTLVGVEEELNKLPAQFYLSQNYPNPFNPTTTIKYSIPTPLNPPFAQGGNSGGFVTLKVYNILGREVAVLVNESQKPGNYKIKFNAGSLSSGVYLYQLKIGGFIKTKKMVLLR